MYSLLNMGDYPASYVSFFPEGNFGPSTSDRWRVPSDLSFWDLKKSHAAKQANWENKTFGEITDLGRKIEFTFPETNSEFAPENGWLEDDPFLLGWPIFRGYVSFMEGKTFVTWSEMDESQIIAIFYWKGSHSWTSKYLVRGHFELKKKYLKDLLRRYDWMPMAMRNPTWMFRRKLGSMVSKGVTSYL